MRHHLALAILLSAITLGACGTRGSLYLPPPQARPSVTAQEAPTSQDTNTAKDSVR